MFDIAFFVHSFRQPHSHDLKVLLKKLNRCLDTPKKKWFSSLFSQSFFGSFDGILLTQFSKLFSIFVPRKLVKFIRIVPLTSFAVGPSMQALETVNLFRKGEVKRI